jgi:hypothetical protein
VDAIANFVHVARANGSAAHDASFDRAASTPAGSAWLICRDIATNILGRIPEDGWHIQHQIGRAVLGSVTNRHSRRI